MTSYFEEFKKTMKGRMRIPVSLVEKHVQDIFFLVDVDYTYIQAAVPKVRWLRPLPYEIDIDDSSTTITTLLAKEHNKEATYFRTHDIVKSRENTDLKIALSMKKKDKIMKKLKSQLGIKDDEGNEEEAEEEGPLAITQGIGEDAEVAEHAPIKEKKRKTTTPPKPRP